jgi:hypothetical protein
MSGVPQGECPLAHQYLITWTEQILLGNRWNPPEGFHVAYNEEKLDGTEEGRHDEISKTALEIYGIV